KLPEKSTDLEDYWPSSSARCRHLVSLGSAFFRPAVDLRIRSVSLRAPRDAVDPLHPFRPASCRRGVPRAVRPGRGMGPCHGGCFPPCPRTEKPTRPPILPRFGERELRGSWRTAYAGAKGRPNCCAPGRPPRAS